MHFFDAKLKKQRAILLEITPRITAVIDEVARFDKMREGGEAAKAAKAARLQLLKAEAQALKAPDNTKAAAKAAEARLKSAEAFVAAESEAHETGLKIITEIIDVILDKQYDGIVAIISALYGTTPKKLEEEKSLFDIVDMVFETLGNEHLMRFFPQLRRLKAETL